MSTTTSTTRPAALSIRGFAGRMLAAAVLAGSLFAAAPRAEAAPIGPAPALADQAESGVVSVQYGWRRHHHHHHHRHWGHHRRWHHHHHGWRHHHHHRHYGWRHRHHRHW